VFSGTIDINVSSGAVTGVEVFFPGLSTFDTFSSSAAFNGTDWLVGTSNSAADTWNFDFSTRNTPSSLVGFTGGLVLGLDVSGPSGGFLYSIDSGTISATPIPGSLILFGTVLLGFFGFAPKAGVKGLPTRR